MTLFGAAIAYLLWRKDYCTVVPDGHHMVVRRGKHDRKYKPGWYLTTVRDRIRSVRWTTASDEDPLVCGKLIPDVIAVDSIDSAVVSSEGVLCTLNKSVRLVVVDHVAAVRGGDVTYNLCMALTDELRSKVRTMSVVDLRAAHGLLQQHMMQYAKGLANCGIAVESFVVRKIDMPVQVTETLDVLAMFKALEKPRMEKGAFQLEVIRQNQEAEFSARCHAAQLKMIDDAVDHYRAMDSLAVEELRTKLKIDLEIAKITERVAGAIKLAAEMRVHNKSVIESRKKVAEEWLDRGMTASDTATLIGAQSIGELPHALSRIVGEGRDPTW